jgi:hypothetical protein
MGRINLGLTRVYFLKLWPELEKILSVQAEAEDILDPWNRRLKQPSFGRFAITTRH